ncbi:MAG TPA: aspartyl/asparaginyl beta-hydroxylase domain-containing protein [Sphingomicrobium sp.]|nr:aspartyl/asparaginyl beta-hydroxylase domain-containing protein [Sphingomicrobium sp.]
MLEEQADRAAAAGDYAAARAMLERAAETGNGGKDLWVKLSAMCKASSDLAGALAAINRALEISPLDFSALLARAVILDKLGDPKAGEEYGNALAQIHPDEEVPGPWQAAVAHARKRRDEWQSKVQQRLLKKLPANLSPAERTSAERLISNHAHMTRQYHQEPSHFHYPGMPEVEFYDPEQFAGVHILEEATDAIRAEFDALIAAEAAEMVPYVQYPKSVPLRQWKELNFNRQWTAIHLLQNGGRIEANARHCPRTLAAIAHMDQPNVRGASPNAMFSLLAPHTRIPPHTGVANTRLVCHLPLIVPPGCGFRCGATTVDWRVGQAFVFDDTIEHEAWNDSDELRVVLIIDLWPPSLSEGGRRAAAAVIEASGATFGDQT